MSVAESMESPAELQNFFDNLDSFSETREGVAKLRQMILQLAVQGKLAPQDPNDEPAAATLERIEQRKSQLATAGEIPKPRSTEPINGEMPFDLQPGWRWVRLGDISLYIEAGWSPRCESHPRERDEWGVLKISAVTWDVFNPNENKALPVGLEPREKCEVKAGDFVMSRANTAELVAKSVWMYVTPLSPLAEQKRIVAKVDQLLSQCDELSARLRERQATTQQLLTATIHNVLESTRVA